MEKPLARVSLRLLSGSLAASLVSGCARQDPGSAPEIASATPAAFAGPDTRVHPMGEVGRALDYTMTVENVKECPVAAPFAPRRGNVKLGVEVVIVGTSQREVPANPFYGLLTDTAGNAYSSTLAGCEPGLPAVRVSSTQSARGFITFEIPAGARKLELRYAPAVIGPGKEELRFAVER